MHSAADSTAVSAPENLEETPAPPTASPVPTISPAQSAQPVHAVPPIAAAPAPAQFGEPVVSTIAPAPPVAAPVSPAPAASAPEPVAPEAAAATVAPAPGAPVSIAPQRSPEATPVSGRATAASPPSLAAPEAPEDEPEPPLAAEADLDDEPLLTLEVWQVGVLVLGVLVVAAHFVAGTPLPAYSAAAKFRMAIKLVAALGGLLLLLALRKRQHGA
jgi:hypothetical protein